MMCAEKYAPSKEVVKNRDCRCHFRNSCDAMQLERQNL